MVDPMNGASSVLLIWPQIRWLVTVFYNLIRGLTQAGLGFSREVRGGWVVSLAATKVEAPAFITMVSPSVSTVAEDRVFQRAASVRHKFGNTAAAEASDLIQQDHLVTRTGTGYENYLRAMAPL